MSITPESIRRAIQLLDAATAPDTGRYVQIGDTMYYIDKNRVCREVTAGNTEGNANGR
jgi:methyl coenzyme M reductase gamma subunit